MSPARRMWLAWCGRWEVPVVALIQAGLIIALAAMALAIPGSTAEGRASELSRPFAGFLFLPFVLGWRLRVLVGQEVVAVAPGQAAWHLRGFAVAVLPPVLLLLVVPALVVGKPLLWSLSQAVCLTLLGVWMGYTQLRAFLPWAAYLAYFLLMDRLVAHPALADRVVAPAALVVAILWAVVATRRVLAHPWSPPSTAGPGWGGWMDRLAPGLRRSASGRRHDLLTPFRLEFGSRETRLLAGIGLPLAGAVTAGVLVWSIPTPHEAWPIAFYMLAFIPWLRVLAWGASEEAVAKAQPAARRILAVERLRPWTREQAAAASLAGVLARALAANATLGLGIWLGCVAAAWWCGDAAAPALWLLPLYGLAAAVCCAVGAVLVHTLTGIASTLASIAAPLIFLVLPMAALPSGTTGQAAMLAAMIVIAVAGLPLARHRLAAAELP